MGRWAEKEASVIPQQTRTSVKKETDPGKMQREHGCDAEDTVKATGVGGGGEHLCETEKTNPVLIRVGCKLTCV